MTNSFQTPVNGITNDPAKNNIAPADVLVGILNI